MSDKTCRLSRHEDKSCDSVFKCFTTCPCPEKNIQVRDEFAEKCKVAWINYKRGQNSGWKYDESKITFCQKLFTDSCRKAGLK